MSSKNPLHADHHIVPIRTYAMTLFALLVLMIATVFIAQYDIPRLGPISGTVLNQAIALAIAVAKATLVIAIFMGVYWSTQLTKFWALIGFTWLSFFAIMAGDYAMRKYEVVQGWEPSQESALPRVVGSHDGSPNAPQPPVNEINVRPRQ